MASAVLDLELTKLPSAVSGLHAYCRALILVRLGGHPVGKAWLPVVDGGVGDGDLRSALVKAGGWPLLERWLHLHLGLHEVNGTDSIPKNATVAVCTRDRAEELQRCLDALMPLTDKGHEILVVDNCPAADATRRLAEKYIHVRYVREDNPGLNAARNRALREARHEVVAFTDDDTVPDPGWLNALLRNLCDPAVLCVTGLTMPLELETEAQEWFERYNTFSRGFRRIVHDRKNRSPVFAGKVGAGANMAVRRSLLNRVGPFDESLDAGTPTRSGGDTEMFSRILASGYRIVYDPAALSWHCHRRTWEELRETIYGYGVGVYAFWTRRLVKEGDWAVFKAAWKWFFLQQFPAVACSLLRRPGRIPLDLLMAELRGCAWGPAAYFISRRRQRRKNPE